MKEEFARKNNAAGNILQEKKKQAYLSQWQLIRRNFLKHRLATIGMNVLILLYSIALFVEFFAPQTPDYQSVDHIYCAPQPVKFSFKKGLYTYPALQHVDFKTKEKKIILDKSYTIPLGFCVRGEPYRMFGLFKGTIHFFGINHKKFKKQTAGLNRDLPLPTFFLLGADRFGRDIFSRVLYGSRISLSIGLLGIFISFLIGVFIGGVSGYFSGKIDVVIQRLIEILNAIPKLPLWLALGAALPSDWSPLKVYFGITIVLSLFGWTRLARVVRGKFLSLREEDYVVAAQMMGASTPRVIFRHMLPGFTSHIIVALTLSVPHMILGETSLSFLGLGLKPPVVSWGVMLQDATNMQALTSYPWLLIPAIFIILTVLSYNFMGDGLRDAADPYAAR